MSCHDGPSSTGPGQGGASVLLGDTASLRVLLVGAPNVGKSTLFNALTGARQRTMNAPGTTVQLFAGTWRTPGASSPLGATSSPAERTIVDLPGTYSLLARSADEQVTADAVCELGLSADIPTRAAGVVVVVLDATALTRSLYLLAQVAETGAPVVVALTMLDLAASTADSQSSATPPAALARALTATLGVPVIPVDARNRSDDGLRDLARAVDDVAAHPRRLAGLDRVAARADGEGGNPPAEPGAELAHAETLFAWVERAVAELQAAFDEGAGIGCDDSTPRAASTPVRTRSDRVDAVLLNPWAGVPVFLAVVWLLFELTTRFAAPLQGALDTLISGPVAAGLTAALGVVGLDDTWVRGFVVDGLLAGLGTVATFMPVMAIMFAALGVLEDSGYLARAAFVADRAMRTLGLDGRALLPLIIGFGCNLPALAATRTLPNARQRLLTGLLIPLTSCAARLTVYILLASAFFPDHAGTVIFAMYLVSVLLVLGGGLLLRRTAFRDVRAEPLILVLPPYQRPGLRTLLSSVLLRVGSFVGRAGKIIVATLLVVWVLMAIPAAGGHALNDVPVGDSLYGRVATSITPVLAPAGFGNEHAAAALLAGFVAKEVVVGSFAQSYSVAEPGDPARSGDLGERLRTSFAESSGGHGGAAALAFMVFVLAYTPCVAALAEQRRLFGWRPTLTALVVQLVVAWVLAVAVFQAGSRL